MLGSQHRKSLYEHWPVVALEPFAKWLELTSNRHCQHCTAPFDDLLFLLEPGCFHEQDIPAHYEVRDQIMTPRIECTEIPFGIQIAMNQFHILIKDMDCNPLVWMLASKNVSGQLIDAFACWAHRMNINRRFLTVPKRPKCNRHLCLTVLLRMFVHQPVWLFRWSRH